MTLAVEGAPAPAFETKDDKGQTVRLADFATKKNVVLYFYPKDDTPGCTREACGFRDNIGQFSSQDTVVLGVSLDDEKSHTAFKQKFSLPFPLLADTSGAICQAYGVAVKDGQYPARVTFVIGKDGKIKKVFSTVKPDEHPAEVLRALQ